MNLCLICLRTDRMLKRASYALEEFHDELCEFSIVTMTSSCHYCSECEYLLTKFYKFKQKCAKALKIYQKWRSTKAPKKQPMNVLYTLLPPSPLGKWAPNSEKIGNFTYQTMDIQTDLCIEVELIKDTYAKEVKQETDQSYNNNTTHYDNEDNNLTDIFKNENTSENGPKSQVEEKKNDKLTEEYLLFEYIDEMLETKTENEESTDLNLIKHKTEVGDKITKILKSMKPRKEMTAKKKTNDKIRETDKQYDSVFEIEYLTTDKMKHEEFERRKTYECYLNAEHKCEICYQVFKNIKFLKYHINKMHTEIPGGTCCRICRAWSAKPRKARYHAVSHTEVFRCKLCPLVTYYRNSMHNHFEQHKGQQYHCEKCNITCKSRSAYNAHIGKVHRRGRNVCEGCGRGFRSPTGLIIHKNNSSRCNLGKGGSLSETVKGVRCEECDVTLPSQEVYDAHINDVHKAPTLRAGRTKPDILKTEAPKKPRTRVRRATISKYACRLCGQVGMSFAWMQLHFKREHPYEDINQHYADKRTHLCDVCGAGFIAEYVLRAHMNLHTGARPHACDLCPKRFRSARLMRAHRVRHFPPAVPCKYCGRRFMTKANLYSHMMTHTGEKKHKCDICGKGFAMRCNLNEHVRGVHYNIRRVKRGGAREGADSAAGGGAKRRKTAADGETDNYSGDSSE